MIVILVMSFCMPSFPSLKNFKDDVEREEKESDSDSNSGGSSSGDSCSSDGDGEDCTGCLELALGIMVLWYTANDAVSYLDYPYADNPYGRNYVLQDEIFIEDNSGNASEKNADLSPDSNNNTAHTETDGGKPWYFTIEGGMQWCGDEGAAFYAAISGKIYKFFGPEIEAKRTDDGKDTLDYYALGINMPLFQFPGCIPDFYVQAAFMRGILEHNGYALGINVSIFPARPFVLNLRFGMQDYGKVTFLDYGAQIGIIYNRFQFFGGYRRIEAEYAEIGGFEAGIKCYL